MQLKLNSCSFTEQVDSSNIAWSHFARPWVKYGQTEKKKRRALAEFSSVLSAFWEAFHGGFPIKYLPAFALMTVKGTWKGNAELCLEVSSIVLCHPTTFYKRLVSAMLRCRLLSPEALEIFCSACNAFQSFANNFLQLLFLSFFSFCFHGLPCSVLKCWFLRH